MRVPRSETHVGPSEGRSPEVRPPTARPRPQIDGDNGAFWQGGRAGTLLIGRCRPCGWWLHPPLPMCPRCTSRDVAPTAVSGRGQLDSFTVNHHPWHAEMPPPYVIAQVGLDEQPGLRVTTNLVECSLDEVQVGLPVEVVFEHRDDVWYPLFRPVRGTT